MLFNWKQVLVCVVFLTPVLMSEANADCLAQYQSTIKQSVERIEDFNLAFNEVNSKLKAESIWERHSSPMYLELDQYTADRINVQAYEQEVARAYYLINEVNKNQSDDIVDRLRLELVAGSRKLAPINVSTEDIIRIVQQGNNSGAFCNDREAPATYSNIKQIIHATALNNQVDRLSNSFIVEYLKRVKSDSRALDEYSFEKSNALSGESINGRTLKLPFF